MKATYDLNIDIPKLLFSRQFLGSSFFLSDQLVTLGRPIQVAAWSLTTTATVRYGTVPSQISLALPGSVRLRTICFIILKYFIVSEFRA
jgi:hypothetical protein